MRKHHFVLVGVALLVAASGLVAVLLWPRDGPVSRARCERVQVGMTQAEVEAVLGGPPGNYSRIPDKEAGLWTIDPSRPDLNRQFFIGREVWVGNELAVAVWFDDQGRVARKESYETLDRGLLQRLRDLLGW